MKQFLEQIEKSLVNRGDTNLDPDGYQDEMMGQIPLNALECFYLFDFKKNKVLFHKGFDSVFGYKIEKMEMDFIFDKYHPEDAPFIKSIVKGSVIQLMQITIPEYANIINMSYRFKKYDGTYANILSNTVVHKTDDQDRVLSVLIKYTDISFTNESDAVEWNVNTTYLDLEKIKLQVYGDDNTNFTSREIQIIQELFNGRTNREIAINLGISKHTVATHRKNILFKSACSNVQELKIFCKKNGIFI